MSEYIKGFSKKTKQQKIDWLLGHASFSNISLAATSLQQYLNSDSKLQQVHDEFSENVISNYYFPYAVAPNFLINGTFRIIPMVIEESSVVAAACKAANFWYDKGGFKAKVINTKKSGHVHFTFKGDKKLLKQFFQEIKPSLLKSSETITKRMHSRGGGVLDIELIDKTSKMEDYFQLHCTFNTLDAMGANFINSCLEHFARVFEHEVRTCKTFDLGGHLNIIMSILSNYVPECIVRAEVSCAVELLGQEGYSGREFVEKFLKAIHIAEIEPYRAVTHNKGIMNGVDAVVLATGNDFRAVEAGAHAYASKDGHYKNLTFANIENEVFSFFIEIPISVGTVGGVTALHPLAKLSMEIMEKPSSSELMEIIAVAGLAQNFSAIRSLVTTGIQKGHMRMHLVNILNQLGATSKEKEQLINYFFSKTISHSHVAEELQKFRENKRIN